MARTVVAIYDGFQRANEAVRELIDNGFPRDNISILANNANGEFNPTISGTGVVSNQAATNEDEAADETGAGAGVGAGIGAAIGGIGGLLIGLGALAIPGIGPVIAAGPLGVALSTLTGAGVGAVAGGVTGGLLGALIGLGIPEEEAEYYTEGVRRGGVLVTVEAEDDNTDHVMEVLNRFQPIDINQKASEWRSQGWTGFNTSAKTIIGRPPTFEPQEDLQPGIQPQIDNPQVNNQPSIQPQNNDQQVNNQPGFQPQVNDQQMNNQPGIQPQNIHQPSVQPQANYPQANPQLNNRQPVMSDPLAETQRASPITAANWPQAEYNADFNVDSPIYLNHYRTFMADAGSPYDYYVPAYRYGYSMAADSRYQNSRWEQIEPNLRRDWEMEHPGTWERFSAAIRHAWEDATERNAR